MEALREYRKMLKISCSQVKTGQNNNYTFEVRLEQTNPHNLLKFQVMKHREEVVQLYDELQKCIFDFDNPFSKNALLNLTKPHVSLLDQINQSLKECLQRIDIIANPSFASFFSIDLHYDDFVSCLKQDKEVKKQEKGMVQQESNSKLKGYTYEKQKKSKQSDFEKIITLASFSFDCDIQLNSTQVLDFTQIRYYQNQVLYVLEQSKKATKVRNFFKNMFSQGASHLGYLSIHRKQGTKYIRTQATELLAEPLSMDYNAKTNMLSICTSVGVYVYLARVDRKLQEIQIFTFIELEGTIDFANNSCKAELYLLRQAQRGELHVYSINREETAKTQYKYVNPSSICFEEQHSRLFVSDKQGIHIYAVIDFLQINRLHCVKVDCLFNKLVENHRFLIGISDRGFMTVLQLKPPQKQQLISVTTNINLPQKSIKIVGSSKNNRLLITNYKNCVAFIDTIEGPFYSFKLRGNSYIKSVFSNKEEGQILALSVDGHMTVLKLSQLII